MVSLAITLIKYVLADPSGFTRKKSYHNIGGKIAQLQPCIYPLNTTLITHFPPFFTPSLSPPPSPQSSPIRPIPIEREALHPKQNAVLQNFIINPFFKPDYTKSLPLSIVQGQHFKLYYNSKFVNHYLKKQHDIYDQ